MTQKQRARLAEIKKELDDLGGEIIEMSVGIWDDEYDVGVALDEAAGLISEALTFIDKAEKL